MDCLFFVPHQDDEVLTMGVAIAQHVKDGDNVKVIMTTDGGGSQIIKTLVNGKSCNKNCDNITDKHNIGLSRDGFVSARDREFKNACIKLGVKPENIIISTVRYLNGKINSNSTTAEFNIAVKEFEEIVSKHITKTNIKVKTTTPYGGDSQIEHRALGQAVKNVTQRKGITDVRYYIDPYKLASYNGANSYWKESESKTSELGKKVIAACKEYGKWKPASPDYLYAIGWHSVPDEFKQAMGETSQHNGIPTNYVHK